MIKTLADEFMDIMNNLDNGCPASRIEGLYNDIKKAESEVKTLNDIIIRMQLTVKESVREQFDELADKLVSAESKLAEAQTFANELCETPLDPHDDALSDAPMRVVIRRILGAHLKEILR